MNAIPRRSILVSACATAAAMLTKAEAVADHPQLEDIQALVFDLRNVSGSHPMCVFVAFQETADRLETLPGVVPVPNENWRIWKHRLNETNKKARYPIGPYLPVGRV